MPAHVGVDYRGPPRANAILDHALPILPPDAYPSLSSMIFCLMDAEEWDSRRRESLVAVPGPEGFVHCSDKHQMSFVRESHFPTGSTVVALSIDPTTLDSETRYEPGSGGELERSPCLRIDSAYGRGRSNPSLNALSGHVVAGGHHCLIRPETLKGYRSAPPIPDMPTRSGEGLNAPLHCRVGGAIRLPRGRDLFP